MEEINCTPPELRATAQEATNKLLPEKFKETYEKEFKVFNTWCSSKGVQIIRENVLHPYFEGLSKTKNHYTLGVLYSINYCFVRNLKRKCDLITCQIKSSGYQVVLFFKIRY